MKEIVRINKTESLANYIKIYTQLIRRTVNKVYTVALCLCISYT